MDKILASPVETVELGMSEVMDLLLDISSQLQATEHFMEEVKSDRAAKAAQRSGEPCPAVDQLRGL